MRTMEHNGEYLTIDTSWRGYDFSEEEIERMLRGESIAFEGKTKDGVPFPCTGTYRKPEGYEADIRLFVPQKDELAEITVEGIVCFVPLNVGPYCDPTEEELRELLAGKVVEIDYKTKKTERQLASIRWYESQGSIWLRLYKHDEKYWLDTQEEREQLRRKLRERMERIRLERAGQWELYLKPSVVAEFFDYDCDRFLASQALRKERPANSQPSVRKQAVNSSASDAGTQWEKKTVEYLKQKYYEVLDFSEKGSCTPDALMNAFAAPFGGDSKARFIYQSEFHVTDALPYHSAVVKPVWSAIKPDLLLVEEDESGNRHISIIDVKLAQQPHMSHKMQVGLYFLLLKQFMKEYCAAGTDGWTYRENCFLSAQGIRVYLDQSSGYLWNCTQPMKELVAGKHPTESLKTLKDHWSPVPYSEVMPFLRDFLANRVESLIGEIQESIQKQPDAVKEDILQALPFCIGSNCGNCANQCKKCIEWGEAANSVQLYPGLSRPAQKYIQTLAKEHGEHILSVDGLRKEIAERKNGAVKNAKLLEQLKSNYTWKRLTFAGNFEKMAAALELRKSAAAVWEPGDAVIDMPKGAEQAETDEETQKLMEKARNDRVASMRIPKKQNAAVIMTLHRDIAADGTTVCYAYGIHLRMDKKAQNAFKALWGTGTGADRSFLNVSGRLCADQDCGDGFISDLHQILSAADSYNQKAEDPRKITLQGYTFDRSEFECIQSLLYEKLSRAEGQTRQKIFDILFWMQGDRIVGALDAHPEHILEFPVAVLSEEVCKLYEVPAFVTVQLWNVAKLLTGEDFREESGKYCKLLSDSIRLSAVYDAKNGPKNLLGYLQKRLLIEAKVLRAVQERAKESLHHELRAFAFPKTSGVEDHRLSKLLFQSLNEFYLDCCRHQSMVMRDPANVIAAKACLWVEFKQIDTQSDRVVCNVVQLHKAGQKRMYEAYLLPIDQKGNPAQEDLAALRAAPLFQRTPEVAVASEVRYRRPKSEGDPLMATFALPEQWRQHSEQIPAAGAKFILLERPSSIQHVKEIEALRIIGNHPGCDALKLLYPEEYYKAHQLIDGMSGEQLLDKEYGKLGKENFVKGQDEAFCHVCDHNITLLQGPPGTGKTDFIGRTVLALIRANKAANKKPLRILVSAYTHAAINNALKKICEKASMAGLSLLTEGAANADADLAVYRDKRSPNQKYLIEDLDTILQLSSSSGDGDAPTWTDVLQEAPAPRTVVIGATCWACRSANPFFARESPQEYFDLVIIDEASQMPTALALMTMAYGRTDSTHYLIVGDNHQLPPIIHGSYSPAPKEVDIHHSVFQFYLDAGMDYKRALSRNFRMNEALCSYSSEKIYEGLGYSGYSEKIKRQELPLSEKEIMAEEKAWVRQILDPKYPLTVVYLSGAAPEEMGRLEVKMVSELTLLLQKHMRKEDGSRYFDAAHWEQSMYAFWGKKRKGGKEDPEHRLTPVSDPAFGILSPYHRQIEKLKEQIVSDMGQTYPIWPDGDDLLIDTVDKLQGQEREAVIVSYGVNDVEEAVAQGEFIYNYQRLNVALTRGKKKTILFLTSALADRPIEMLDANDPELLKGVAFLCGLKDYMKQPQERFESDVADPFTLDGVRVDIYRKRYTG